MQYNSLKAALYYPCMQYQYIIKNLIKKMGVTTAHMKTYTKWFPFTVPTKCKLTVSIESVLDTRYSIPASIEYRVSSIVYRVSSIVYRVSCIEYRVSSTEKLITQGMSSIVRGTRFFRLFHCLLYA